jgi:hypothetical protein
VKDLKKNTPPIDERMKPLGRNSSRPKRTTTERIFMRRKKRIVRDFTFDFDWEFV